VLELLWRLPPAVCLVIHGFINMMSARWMARFMTFSGTYQLLAAVIVIFLIPFLAPTHQSPDFVFFTFYGADVSATGAPSSAYLFILGMLMSQYTITGYDA
jgi:amino acid transporter